MFYIRKGITELLLIAGAAVLLTGCSSPKSRKEEKAYREQGIVYMTTGEYSKAAEAFQDALDQATGIGDMEVDICMYRAEALYRAGDPDGAMEVYTSLLDYEDNADIHFLRGNLYYSMGDYESGWADFQAAMGAGKEDYDLLLEVADTLNKYGETEEEEEILNEIIQSKGDKGQACLRKGRAFMMMGDYTSAESYLQKAIEDGVTEANFYLAQLYAGSGNDELADQYYQTYVDSGSGSAADLMKLGEASAEGEDYQVALKYFLAAGEMDTTTIAQELMKDTIAAYEYTGDFDSAETLLEEYLAAYPDDYDAEDEMIFLKTRVSTYHPDGESTETSETEKETEDEQ